MGFVDTLSPFSGCEDDSEVAQSVGPPRANAQLRALELHFERISPEPRADLDAKPLALVERDLQIQLRHRDDVGRACLERDVHPLVLRIPTRLVDEPALLERGAELAIDRVE